MAGVGVRISVTPTPNWHLSPHIDGSPPGNSGGPVGALVGWGLQNVVLFLIAPPAGGSGHPGESEAGNGGSEVDPKRDAWGLASPHKGRPHPDCTRKCCLCSHIPTGPHGLGQALGSDTQSPGSPPGSELQGSEGSDGEEGSLPVCVGWRLTVLFFTIIPSVRNPFPAEAPRHPFLAWFRLTSMLTGECPVGGRCMVPPAGLREAELGQPSL